MAAGVGSRAHEIPEFLTAQTLELAVPFVARVLINAALAQFDAFLARRSIEVALQGAIDVRLAVLLAGGKLNRAPRRQQ